MKFNTSDIVHIEKAKLHCTTKMFSTSVWISDIYATFDICCKVHDKLTNQNIIDLIFNEIN